MSKSVACCFAFARVFLSDEDDTRVAGVAALMADGDG